MSFCLCFNLPQRVQIFRRFNRTTKKKFEFLLFFLEKRKEAKEKRIKEHSKKVNKS